MNETVDKLREVVKRNKTDRLICCQCGNPANRRWVQTFAYDEPTMLFCSWRCTAAYAELSTEDDLYTPPGDPR